MASTDHGVKGYIYAGDKQGIQAIFIAVGWKEGEFAFTEQPSTREDVIKMRAPDLILEATGNSTIAFQAMEVLNLNGVLVWTSITGGKRRTDVPSDHVNLNWVLGNKLLLGSVNANRRHFELGIADLALGEVTYPGVVERILTNPVHGVENYKEMMRLLVEDKDALKVYVDVAEG